MSQITIDRSVLEQVLEALGTGIQYDYHGNPYSDNDAARCGAYDALRAALEQPDTNTVSEPVAWRCFDGEGDFEYLSEEPSEETRAWSARYNREWEPLYIHPQNLNCKSTQARLATLWGYEKKQPRQPLTKEEIFRAIRPLWNSDTNCQAIIGLSVDEYRAIEAAHGIGGEK